jgi:hypothetical protein
MSRSNEHRCPTPPTYDSDASLSDEYDPVYVPRETGSGRHTGPDKPDGHGRPTDRSGEYRQDRQDRHRHHQGRRVTMASPIERPGEPTGAAEPVEPAEPTSVEPRPAEPTPVDPVEPRPVEPRPVEPDDPRPVEPDDPRPARAAPVEPKKSRRASPRRRRSPKKQHRDIGTIYLQVGDVRSDPELDTSLRAISRVHWHNEPAVIRMMQNMEDGVRLVAPMDHAVSPDTCNAAFRMLQLSDDSEGRTQAREMLVALADAGEDVVDAVLIVMYFTQARDANTRATLGHALLLSPSPETPERVLEAVKAAGALRSCGPMLFASALHVAFGTDSSMPPGWDVTEADFERIDSGLAWVANQADRLDAGFVDCPLVEYDMATVNALARVVVALDADEGVDVGTRIFGGWLVDRVLEFEQTLAHSRQRKSYRKACDQVARTCGSRRIPW